MDRLNRLVPALIIFAAAVILAGTLVWFGLRSTSGSSELPVSPSLPGASSPTAQGPVPGVPVFHTPIVGRVIAVGSGSVTVAATSQTAVGAPISTSTVSTVVDVNSETDIYKEGPLMSAAVFQQEAAAFREKIQNANPSITYVGPDQYTHTALQLSEIAPGDLVYVIPTEDMQTPGGTVTASSIEVNPAPH